MAREESLTPFSSPRCRSCPAFWRAPQRTALELPRRAARSRFSAIKRVAEHSGDRFFSAQEMHLKAVRLFFGARLGVDAADVLFRIRIGSSSHELRLTTTSNNARINESRYFYLASPFSPAPASPRFAIFCHTRRRKAAHNTDAARNETTRSFSRVPFQPSWCNQ